MGGVRLVKGDTVIVNPNVWHKFVNCDPKIKIISIGINNFQIQGLENNCLVPKNCSPIISSNMIFKDIDKYFVILKSLNLINNKFLKYNTHTHLINSLLTLLYNATLSSKKNIIEKENLIDIIKYYIDLHFLEEISLDRLSSELHLNKYYILHIFKRYTGTSPIKYINTKRLQEAQYMLISKDLNITDIAFRCGFNSSNYFQTYFKNEIGITPVQYRKKWK